MKGEPVQGSLKIGDTVVSVFEDVPMSKFQWLGVMDTSTLMGKTARLGYLTIPQDTPEGRASHSARFGPPNYACPVLQSYLDLVRRRHTLTDTLTDLHTELSRRNGPVLCFYEAAIGNRQQNTICKPGSESVS